MAPPAAPGLALALTNYHLLVATEDESSNVGTVSYGFIARCYPRAQLQAIHLAPEGDDLWLELSVGVGGCMTSEHILVTSAAGAGLDDLLARLTGVGSGVR